MDDRVLQASANSSSTNGRFLFTFDVFEVEPAGLLSDFTRFMFEVVVWVCLCGAVSMVGIVTNTVNLVVFIRQGILSESVTANLAGLAVADLCCVTTMFLYSINFVIVLWPPPGIPWDPLSVMYLAAGWPRIMFTRVTCCITSYVALERCMCVVLPFKVKQLFTATRSICVITCIFVFIISSYIPIYYTHRLGNVRDPSTNKTLVGMVLLDNAYEVDRIIRKMNNIILPTIFMTVVIVCTQVTASRLIASSKWRKKNATSGYQSISKSDGNELQSQGISNKQSDCDQVKQKVVSSGKPAASGSNTSSKETKVVKMITFICTIFIICNSPCVIIFYTRLFIPEIANGGRYNNFFWAIYSLDFLLETINSSINIVVYYKMSSKYKQEFRSLFGMKE